MYEDLMSRQLILNSIGELILIQLADGGEIRCIFYDSKSKFIKNYVLYKEDVLIYSATVDEKDIIHLVALLKSGELNYSKYENGNWSNAIIGKFDIQSNIYNNLKIYILNGSINIIYCFANLINSNIWTIQHAVNEKQNWNKYNVISFISDKISIPFNIDTDSLGTTHLLYRSINSKSSQIFHIFNNPFINKWCQHPEKISTLNYNKTFPYLFIDTFDNLHGIWLEAINKNYVLKYYKANYLSHKKYIWNEIKIPLISNCINTPILFEENGVLKILYLTENDFGYLYSLDYGNTWYEGETLNVNTSKIYSSRLKDNFFKSNKIKINDLYYSFEDNIKFYFVDSLDYLNGKPEEKNPTSSEKYSTKEVFAEDIEKVNLQIQQLLINSEKKSIHLEEIKNIVIEVLETQKSIEDKIVHILELLDTQENSFFTKFFNFLK